MKIEFTVPGIPVGKGRPRFTKNGHAHTPQKTRDYENKVVQCWKCQSGEGFAGGIPLTATVTAFFTVPRSTSKKKAAMLDGTPHIKRPDADNVAKAILDAIAGLEEKPAPTPTPTPAPQAPAADAGQKANPKTGV